MDKIDAKNELEKIREEVGAIINVNEKQVKTRA